MNLRRLLRRSTEDADLALELESHLQHEIDDNLARGMTPEVARRQAHVKLGNSLVIRDRVWETNRLKWIEDAWRDLRYAARTLAKAPSFTWVALLVMALGIGANTAIYSFVDALLLRSLPVSDPQSLVVIGWHAKSEQDSVTEGISGRTDPDPRLGVVGGIFPYPAFELFQKDDVDFSEVFSYCATREVSRANVVIHGDAEVAHGEFVSGGYFKGLGVVPAAGRLIVPDDDRQGAATVAVISYNFAKKHFADAPAI